MRVSPPFFYSSNYTWSRVFGVLVSKSLTSADNLSIRQLEQEIFDSNKQIQVLIFDRPSVRFQFSISQTVCENKK